MGVAGLGKATGVASSRKPPYECRWLQIALGKIVNDGTLFVLRCVEVAVLILCSMPQIPTIDQLSGSRRI